MRTKFEISQDGTKVEKLLLEVLLDIRELLHKQTKVTRKKRIKN